MNMHLSRLFTGVLAWIGLGTALFAQNAQLRDDLSVLVRVSATTLVALDNEGALLRSDNGGVEFTTVRAVDDDPLRELYTVAASGSTVIAMGYAGDFVRSTNGGASYSSLAYSVPAFNGQINAVAAHNGSSSTTWIAVGFKDTGPVVLRSIDDGVNWSPITVSTAAIRLNGVVWTGNRWVMVGDTALLSGIILTSTDGTTWTDLATSEYALYSVASDGAGNVLIGGDAGTLLYASDGGATPTSFTSEGDDVTSEAIRAVAFLSGTNWVAGGDQGVIVSFNSANIEATPAVKASGPSETNSKPVTALAYTGSGITYYYSEPAATTPESHGPISLTATQSGGQIQLTLVGAESGNSYYLESSTTLSSWDVVGGSTQVYDGVNAPTWLRPLPEAGLRVFYRAANVTP